MVYFSQNNKMTEIETLNVKYEEENGILVV